MYLKIFICLCVVSLSLSAENLSLKKCKKSDAKFNDCLKSAINDAFTKSTKPAKDFGLQKLEPLEIPSLVIGAGAGVVGFQQVYKNVKINGFSKLKCDKINMNFDAKTMTLECNLALAKMNFDYEVNGKILLLPIYGKGPGSIELHKLFVSETFKFEEYTKNGKKHLKIIEEKCTLKPGFMRFRLDNLFDGDKSLSENVNQVLNDNWSEVFSDVSKKYEDAFGQIFRAVFSRVLAKVPIDELFG